MKSPFNKEFKIADRWVGYGHPSYLIAEIGANFNGDINMAKNLCLAAKEAGADCAKFQTFKSEKIVSAKGFATMKLKGVHGSWNRPVDEVFKEVEFPREWHKEIMDYCNKIGIHFSTSPYDKEAVDLCVQLNIPFIKIGSGEITWLEQLEYIAKTQKPIMIATGDATLSEIDEALRIIESTGNRNVVLMQCITNYPSMIENANINVLKTYQTAFDILTGYSDHAAGPVVCIGATAIGSVAIEKHFTLDKKDKGPDHPHSMEMNEFKQMVDYIRQLELAMGTSRKFIVEEETETVIVQRRGLYATRNIKAGEILTLEDIEELRPALGILPKYKTKIVGKKANNDIEKGMPIYWESF